MTPPPGPHPLPLPFQEIADQVYCIETGLYRHGLAACYLVRSADRLAFVDTGTARAVPGLLQVIAALGLGPEHVDYVIPTHVHLDHAGGAGDLMQACPQAGLIIHPRGAPHMIDPTRLIAGATAVYGADAFARDYGGLTPVAETRIELAWDGMGIDLAGRTLTFFDTPGHANHHGCLFDSATRGCFTGDTFGISYREFDGPAGPWLFAPTTPVAFDPEAWLQTLDKLMGLTPRSMYLTHYGRLDRPEDLVGDLRRSIRDMAEVALQEEGRDDPDRAARLKAAVADRLMAAARAHGVGLDAGRMAELLALDTELNAHGLDVWLKRRERQTGGG